ncbi:MAG TPA: AsmA family protein [Pseudolabrys sp.]|nr:AsmA family protein [Pseudolabrys sp.]
MQTTLLGLAIAIILALVAALVGPFVIDWSSHRSVFENEASRFVGTKVRVAGAIDARLLPSPRLVLHDVTIGPNGGDQVRLQSVAVEFGLGPLMRGEWHATEMDVGGPQLNLGLDKSGRLQMPAIAVKFDPDAFSVDRLSIHDGKIVLKDAANGRNLVLDKVWFNGDARSLLGPVKGEGAFRLGDDLYPYRLSASRLGDDDTLKLRLNIDPVTYPLSIESDGTLSFANDTPHFDGTLKVARPVAIAQRGANSVTQPWRVDGKIKISPSSALMEQVEFQYGSDAQAIKLTGTADLEFGAQPHFEGVLSARQIDVDRALGSGNETLPPAAAFRKLAEWGAAAFRPTFPIRLGLSIDQVTLGGNTVQSLQGDISTDAKGWNLERFEFRAPGFTQVRLSGQLVVDAAGVTFTGPAAIDADNPRKFASWLTGKPETAKGQPRPLHVRGDMVLGSEKIAVERLQANFDREAISGQLVYTFAAGKHPSRLNASLSAPELDLDAALGFSKALFAGSSIERPHDVTVALDIGHVTLGGIEARQATARLRVDANGLDVERLAVADFGGAAFSASGRIDTSTKSPHGSIAVDLDARDLTSAAAVLARFAPGLAEKLPAALEASPAKLHADLNLAPAGKTAEVRLDIRGTLGGVQVALNGAGATDVDKRDLGNVRVTGKLAAKDSRALVALFGLDRLVAVGNGAGTLTFTARGPAHGDLRIDGKLAADGLDTSADGTMRIDANGIETASMRLSVAHADAAPAIDAIGAAPAALPVAFTGRVTLSGSDVKFADLDGTIAGTHLRGDLGLALGAPARLSGEINADRLDAAALVGAAAGFPRGRENPAWHWTSDPFVRGAFAPIEGQITVKATRAALTPRLTARELRGTLEFGKDEMTLDNVSGDLAGGHFAGQLAFRKSGEGLAAHLKVALDGADVTAMLPASTRPPLAGKLALKAELDGSGMSPSALIGSLHGSGSVGLTSARIAGLNPQAFDAVAGAVDNGMPVDAAKISDVVGRALESGRLSVASIGGNIAAAAGQIRLNETSAHASDADVAVTGTLDLTDGTIDARLVLSGADRSATSTRPDIFLAVRGPLSSPSRSVDVSALTGWLMLRSVEHQAKKLESIERDRAAAVEAAPKPAAEPATPVSEPPSPAAIDAEPKAAAPQRAPAPPPAARHMPSTVAEKKPVVHAPVKRHTAPALPPPLVIRPAPNPAPEFSVISPN